MNMKYYSTNAFLTEKDEVEALKLVNETINLCRDKDSFIFKCAFVDGNFSMGYEDGLFVACNPYIGRFVFRNFGACAVFLCASGRVSYFIIDWFYSVLKERFDNGQI